MLIRQHVKFDQRALTHVLALAILLAQQVRWTLGAIRYVIDMHGMSDAITRRAEKSLSVIYMDAFYTTERRATLLKALDFKALQQSEFRKRGKNFRLTCFGSDTAGALDRSQFVVADGIIKFMDLDYEVSIRQNGHHKRHSRVFSARTWRSPDKMPRGRAVPCYRMAQGPELGRAQRSISRLRWRTHLPGTTIPDAAAMTPEICTSAA